MTNEIAESRELLAREQPLALLIPEVVGAECDPATLHLVHSFLALKMSSPNAGVFAFTSARPGEGVTYVTTNLGAHLAAHTGERVLVIEAASLGRLSATAVEQDKFPFVRSSSGVWVDGSDDRLSRPKMTTRPEKELWPALRKRFGYILIDCGALSSSTEVITIGFDVDASILIVAAGETPKHTLQHAVRVLTTAKLAIAGCILNKRTYPIPNSIYNLV